jgi:hypothetical protein
MTDNLPVDGHNQLQANAPHGEGSMPFWSKVYS